MQTQTVVMMWSLNQGTLTLFMHLVIHFLNPLTAETLSKNYSQAIHQQRGLKIMFLGPQIGL